MHPSNTSGSSNNSNPALQEEVQNAINAGDFERAKAALANGAKVVNDASDAYGNRDYLSDSLALAIGSGNEKIINLLLMYGANPNAMDDADQEKSEIVQRKNYPIEEYKTAKINDLAKSLIVVAEAKRSERKDQASVEYKAISDGQDPNRPSPLLNLDRDLLTEIVIQVVEDPQNLSEDFKLTADDKNKARKKAFTTPTTNPTGAVAETVEVKTNQTTR